MEETLTRVKWEKNSLNVPDLHPASNATIAAIVAGGISISATALQDAAGWKWTALFGLLTGLIAFLLYFTLLLIRQSQLGIREWTVETPVMPEGAAVRLMVPNDNNPKGILAAGYTMSEGQVRRLAVALNRAEWMFLRDVVRGARAFPKTDYDNWERMLERFQNAELVDAARRVTPKGIDLFSQFLPTPPRPFNATENSPARPRPPYARGEGDTGSGAGGSGAL